jgi:hypothetical protein
MDKAIEIYFWLVIVPLAVGFHLALAVVLVAILMGA